jgi:hypothetical protein
MRLLYFFKAAEMFRGDTTGKTGTLDTGKNISLYDQIPISFVSNDTGTYVILRLIIDRCPGSSLKSYRYIGDIEIYCR